MESPARIRVLPVHVANKIAAGEVVDRPASVLKELVENAIDGGATQIDVDVAAGGRTLVAVGDNGSGMIRDDALLSIERHATSKISDVDDIEKIHTLGFRGEALAAIASVSRFRMTTCREGETVGTEITVAGGKMQDVRDIGCPAGTRVEVRDLFFNVPARRKFLRSYQTEQAYLRTGFIVQALAHPEIGLSLRIDNRDLSRLPRNSTLEDRIRDLFGPDLLKSLRKADHAAGGVKVTGFVSLPAASRSDRNEQYFFVNGRATTAPVFGYAVREGYHTLLAGDRHPILFLFLELDPTQVDVNVHPTKKEVRFRRSDEVRDGLIAAIRKALGTAGALPLPGRPAEAAPSDAPARPVATEMQLKIENLPETRAFRYPRLPIADSLRRPSGADGRDPAAAASEPPAGAAAGAEPAPAAPWSWCRVLGQVGNLYVVLETEDGYVLMDPHAAHERVTFERFMADVRNGKVQTQSLLLPENVELLPKDTMRVRKHLEIFRNMGFGLSEFGGDAFVVDALPSHFAGTAPAAMLAEIAHELEQAGARGGQGRWREEAIAQAACKASVKRRDRLTLAEIEQLVVDLARTEMPYTCPHGRPTLIFTSFKELNRKFGRE